jgi:hypothetical protein
MVLGGNALTFFRFHLAAATWEHTPEQIRFALRSRHATGAGIQAEYILASSGTRLPASSRFADLPSAQAFLAELYAAFGAQRPDGRVEVVRIARTLWQSAVITEHSGTYEAMTTGRLFHSDEARLDSIFYVRELHYRWQPLELVRRTG